MAAADGDTGTAAALADGDAAAMGDRAATGDGSASAEGVDVAAAAPAGLRLGVLLGVRVRVKAALRGCSCRTRRS